MDVPTPPSSPAVALSDPDRLLALAAYAVLDTPPQVEFDDLARLAAKACEAPIAYIAFLDDHRQFVKAVAGVDRAEAERYATRAAGFCQRTIAAGIPLVIPDTTADSKDVPDPAAAVDALFYAAVPLKTADGHVVGTLCVVDQVARDLSPDQSASLAALGRQVITLLELQRHRVEHRRAEASTRERDELFRTVFQQAPDDAIIITDADRVITAWNPAAERITGWSASEAVGRSADIIFTPEDMAYDAAGQEMRQAAAQRRAPDERWHVRRNGSRFWGSGTMNSLHAPDGRVTGFVKVFRDATKRHIEAESLAFLRKLTDAIFDHPAPQQIIETTQRLLGEHLQASRVMVSEVLDDGQTVKVTQSWSMPGLRDLTGVYHLDDYGEQIRIDYLAGRTHVRCDTEREYSPGPELENVRAVQAIASIDVPVLIDGKLRAVLIVHQATARDWTDDEIALAQQVADRMVAELERAEAIRASHERETALAAIARQRDALLDLQRAVTAAATVGDNENATGTVLNAAAAHLLAVVPAATGAVLETLSIDADGVERLLYVAAAGSQASHIGTVIRRTGSLSGKCLDDCRPLVCDDIDDDPRVDRVRCHELGIRSLIVVPIVRGDTNLGVLKVTSDRVGAFLEVDTVALRLAAGAIAGGLSGAAEVRAIDALRRSEARFRELADAMPQIVFTAKPDGTVDYFNRRWYEYTGFDPALIGDASWEGVHHPQDRDDIVRKWFEAINSRSPYEGEQRYRRRSDGTYRWHLVRTLPVHDDYGTIVRWFGTSTDIHEFKLLQTDRENLLAAERSARAELERASGMKDEFLATLGHELRTPLNAIVGWVQILKSASTDPDTVNEGLAVIDRNARAQTQIIEDILDMRRIISGKMRLDVQSIDLAALVRAGVDTVQPAADAKGVRLIAVLDPLSTGMAGDPNRLHQVFWNLISNAVKFTPRGGSVRVLLERVGSHVEVSVIDTGEGIATEFLPFVFDRFRQAEATTTRRHGGLGLGLSIVKQLVEMHGGSVRVHSAGRERGTTFTVALPVAVVQLGVEDEQPDRAHPATEPSSGPTHAAGEQLKAIDVLIVDDETDSRDVLRRLLADCGATVRAAASAVEAFRMFSERTPAVLVSDIGMPGEDGYSLVRRIRALADSDGGAVPAIALTAYARSNDRIKALEAGFQSHLTKPVKPAELVITVTAMAKSSLISRGSPAAPSRR